MVRVKMPLLMTALVFILAFPAQGAAELFSDLYFGTAFTQDETMTIAGPTGNVSGEIDFEEAFGAGYRLGYWFEGVAWLGFSLEASYFQNDLDESDLTIVPITPLLMLRWPLSKSSRFPSGEWQPYAAAGPGLFYSKLNGGGYDDDRYDIGVDARLGLKKMIERSFGIFIEYRFTSFSPEYDDPIVGEIDIQSHYAIIGISLTI